MKETGNPTDDLSETSFFRPVVFSAVFVFLLAIQVVGLGNAKRQFWQREPRYQVVSSFFWNPETKPNKPWLEAMREGGLDPAVRVVSREEATRLDRSYRMNLWGGMAAAIVSTVGLFFTARKLAFHGPGPLILSLAAPVMLGITLLLAIL